MILSINFRTGFFLFVIKGRTSQGPATSLGTALLCLAERIVGDSFTVNSASKVGGETK
jgi:hypothetical protein